MYEGEDKKEKFEKRLRKKKLVSSLSFRIVVSPSLGWIVQAVSSSSARPELRRRGIDGGVGQPSPCQGAKRISAVEMALMTFVNAIEWELFDIFQLLLIAIIAKSIGVCAGKRFLRVPCILIVWLASIFLYGPWNLVQLVE